MMTEAVLEVNCRVILYHKQATSARTRFVLFNDETVLAFAPVSRLAQLDDDATGNTRLHPSAILRQAEQRLGLEPDSLKAEADFQHSIDVPGDDIPVLLAAFTTMDPPFEAIEQAGGAFIDLTQARGLPPVELELLRHAYELLLGG